MKRFSASSIAQPFTGLLVLLISLLAFSPNSMAKMPRGSIGFDAAYFPDNALFADQHSDSLQASAFGSLDWSADITRDIRFDLSGYFHFAPQAHDTIFGDLREAIFRARVNTFDIKAGVLLENWKVLEAWSPVDLVNQKDTAEDYQGNVKLGQPGISVQTFYSDLVLSALILPYNRERRVAEGKDRLRTLPAPILDSTFENGQSDTSFALRIQYRLGDLDLALSQFWGHSREPVYLAVIEQSLLIGFNEYYEDIAQTGLEIQYVLGDTVLKTEFINQTGGGDNFTGGGIGSETTFNRITNGFDAITVYLEGYYDSRNELTTLTPFQKDIYAGFRYNLNDVSDSLVDLRFTHDLEFHSNLIDVKASRRLGSSQIISAQCILPLSVRSDTALNGFQQDKQIKFSWTLYL